MKSRLEKWFLIGSFDEVENKKVVIASTGLGVIFLALIVIGSINAFETRDDPFPGYFYDPFGYYSTVHLPHWPSYEKCPVEYETKSKRAFFHLKDRIVLPKSIKADKGESVLFPGDLFKEYLLSYKSNRIPTLEIEHSDKLKPLKYYLKQTDPSQAVDSSKAGCNEDSSANTIEILRLGNKEIGVFFILYTLVGILLLWTGVTILLVSPKHSGTYAYAFWTISIFLFFISFYDYHTSRKFTQVFTFSTIAVQLGMLWLAYAFPKPIASKYDILKKALIGVSILGVITFIYLVIAPIAGIDAIGVRFLVTSTSPACLLSILIAALYRHIREKDKIQEFPRAALIGLTIGPLIIGVGFAALVIFQMAAIHTVLPIVVTIIPLSIGIAIIQNNILETPYVLRSGLFKIPMVLGSLIIVVIVWIAIEFISAYVGDSFELVIIYAFLVLCFLLLLILSYWLYSKLVFRSRSVFRPSIEYLVSNLANLREMFTIKETIESVVKQWLPTQKVMVLGMNQVEDGSLVAHDYLKVLRKGTHVWTQDSPWRRKLYIPMVNMEQLWGILELSPKVGRTLYTDDDIALLENIGKIGGLAIQNAKILTDLENQRKLEQDLAKSDKQTTLSMVSAEISHELVYSFNYFKFLLSQGKTGNAFTEEDLRIGQEEIDRVRRMLSNLKRLGTASTSLNEIPLIDSIHRVERLLRDMFEKKEIVFSVQGMEGFYVNAETDLLVQIFTNLLRNAIDAVRHQGKVGISLSKEEDSYCIDVWDNGPGVSPEIQDSLFKPFVTLTEGGTGLGLAVTQRILSGFGWKINYIRTQDKTIFRLFIPKMDCRFAGIPQ